MPVQFPATTRPQASQPEDMDRPFGDKAGGQIDSFQEWRVREVSAYSVLPRTSGVGRSTALKRYCWKNGFEKIPR
jgi:hypothetical protein